MEIASDTTLMHAYRFRALEVLKLFEKEWIIDFLENFMGRDQSSYHLRRAFEAFSRGFAVTQPECVQQAAQKLLNNTVTSQSFHKSKALTFF